MRRVLIIAYFFPPAGGGNVARVHAFTKYLPRFGWQPIVLTTDAAYYLPFFNDDTLTQSYDDWVIINRTASLEPKSQLAESLRANVYGVEQKASLSFQKFGKPLLRQLYRLLVMPDEQILWLPYAVKKGLQLIKQHQVEAIFATTPPHSVGIIGALISRLSGKPFLLDVRDDWVGSPLLDTGPWHRHLFSRITEKWVVNTARAVTPTTQPSKQQFQAKYPIANPEKFQIIPNGYDPEEISRAIGAAQPRPTDKLRLVYIGGLPSKRTPLPLFQALAQLPIHVQQLLQVDIYGYARQEFIEMSQTLGLGHIVNFCGFVSRQESLRQLAAAQVGLVIIPNEEGGQTAIPGKVYEYIGANKVVLALCAPDSAVGTLVKAHNLGLAVPNDDADAIKEALLALVDRYQQQTLTASPAADLLQYFDRVHQTQRLANLLAEIVA